MGNVNRAYTAAIVGDPATSELGPFVAALAESISSFGEVVSGDYLEKKNLSDKLRLFHIGCYHDDLLVDVIHCPLTFKNFAVAAAQASRLVWVIRPDQIVRNHRCAIELARAFDVPSAVLACNMWGIDEEYLADEEMSALLEEEAQQLLAAAQITPDLTVTTCLGSGGNAAQQTTELAELAQHLFDHERVPQVTETDDPTLMLVEQCYSVKGPGGKPARVAYGAVKGRSLVAGELLNIPGLDDGTKAFRVSEIQQFGENVREVCPGSSASLMFHGAPKDLPRAGQLLASKPADFVVTDELRLEVSVLRGESIAQIVAGNPTLELAAGPTCVSAKLVELNEATDDPGMGVLQLKLSTPLPATANQHVMLGRDLEILAWGTVHGDVFCR
jgi:hypothetical protein